MKEENKVIRKIQLYLVLSFSLLFASCATTGPGGGGSPSPDAIVQQVIQITSAVCSFVPTVNTIREILDIAAPGLGTATAIAAAICNAVVPPRAVSPGVVSKARLGKVHSVRVRGKFI